MSLKKNLENAIADFEAENSRILQNAEVNEDTIKALGCITDNIEKALISFKESILEHLENK